MQWSKVQDFWLVMIALFVVVPSMIVLLAVAGPIVLIIEALRRKRENQLQRMMESDDTVCVNINFEFNDKALEWLKRQDVKIVYFQCDKLPLHNKDHIVIFISSFGIDRPYSQFYFTDKGQATLFKLIFG